MRKPPRSITTDTTDASTRCKRAPRGAGVACGVIAAQSARIRSNIRASSRAAKRLGLVFRWLRRFADELSKVRAELSVATIQRDG